MKTLIRIYIAMFVILFTHGQLQSQPRDGRGKDLAPEEKAQKMTDRMKSDLSLKETQVSEAYIINLAFVQKAEALRLEEIERSEKQGKLKSLRDEHQESLKKILSEEQFLTLQARHEERKNKMKDRQGRPE